MKIFLDDDPIRDSWVDDTWTIVRNPLDCLTLLDDNHVEILSLDHDLGFFVSKDNEFTGYDVAQLIERWAFANEWDRVPDKIEIHSGNSVGRKNIQAAIDSIERMRNEI
jgi:hypothetical protein